MPKDPWFKFYPEAWESDTKLQSCSLEAQGFLVKVMNMMHQSEKPGHLLINGLPPPRPTLCSLARLHHKTWDKNMDELLSKGVLIDEDGVIVCPRMVRDHALREMRREVGKMGGNPALVNQDLNSEVNYKRLEVRDIEKDEKIESVNTLSSEQPKCPHQQIVDLYHHHLPGNPKVRMLGKNLKKQLNARWKEYPDLKWWEEYLLFVAECKFLTGRVKDWSASLSWLSGPINVEKVLNNEYHQREKGMTRYTAQNLEALRNWMEKKE